MIFWKQMEKMMEILGESIDSIGQDSKILGKPRGNYGFNNGRSIYFMLSMVLMGNHGKRLEDHRECLIGESWEKMGKSHGGSLVRWETVQVHGRWSSLPRSMTGFSPTVLVEDLLQVHW